MLRSLIPLLACPDCRSPLQISDEPEADEVAVQSGTLSCSECESTFAVDRGIPRLMPKHLLDAQKDEMQARDAQVKQYDANGFLNVFGRFEIPKTLAALAPTPTDLLVEAGCGTGRMTAILSKKVRELVAIDFSYSSLLSNAEKLRAAGISNVHLAQADICNLPFADAVFDRALSCQVLEHVPGHEARCQAVGSIGRVAKPGATVVFSGYQYSAFMGAKEGRHAGGIPFFRFTKAEFSELLGTAFKVHSVTGSLVYLYLARCGKAQATD
jgi:ubiquinone/menaquinone biosynthesis C-methylase UbiE